MPSFSGNALDALRQWLTQGDTVNPATTGPNLGTIDTELPAAAALGVTAPNPTAPAVGAFLMSWDGVTWNPVAGSASAGDAIAGDGSLFRVRTVPHNYVSNGATWDRLRTPNIFKPQNALSISTEATVWTPAAGKKFRLMGLVLAASAAGNIVLRDNTAGTIIAVVPSAAGGAGVSVNFGNGILSATANNVLTATGAATATLSGTIFGTEE